MRPTTKKMLDFAKYFVGNNKGNIFSTINWAEEYLVALQELRQISQTIKIVHRCVTRNFQKGPKKGGEKTRIPDSWELMREIASIRNTSSSARNQANTPKKRILLLKNAAWDKKKRLDRNYDDQDPRDRTITRGINRPTQLRSDWGAGKEGAGGIAGRVNLRAESRRRRRSDRTLPTFL